MTNQNGDQIVVINCGKCATPYRVHGPALMRVSTPALSQATLFPSWSVDERMCPKCKTVNAPVLGDLQILWVPMEAKEPNRIVPATMLPPRIPIK
jgi:hypothetical protein